MKNNDWTVREKPYDLRERLFLFACLIVRVVQFLHTRGPIAVAFLTSEDACRRSATSLLTTRPFGSWELAASVASDLGVDGRAQRAIQRASIRPSSPARANPFLKMIGPATA